MAFRISITADFYDECGEPKYSDLGLSVFEGHDSIDVAAFSQHNVEIGAEQLADAHAVLVLTPKVTAESLRLANNLLVVSRFGVGFDSVDVASCTQNDVLVTIAKGAVDRPVAEATIAWMLALNHKVFQKDKLVRSGNWDARSNLMGTELRDKTLGVVGLGGIGSQLVALIRGFGMKQPIAFDPFASAEVFDRLGVKRCSLDEVLGMADFVSLHCPLTEDTRDLIGPSQLNLMKPTAYLLNLARGGVVNEDALFEALSTGQIAGAALDCFVDEPVTTPHRFGDFENVILAPHSIAWTDELFRDIGRMSCNSIAEVLSGNLPHGVVNPEVFDKESFKAKWRRVVSGA